jgi:hypothetical protein
MKGYLFTSTIEETFRPPEAITNLFVPERCVAAYDHAGRLKRYDTDPESLASAQKQVDGEMKWDGRLLGEVDIPEEILAQLTAEGAKLVDLRAEIEKLGKSKEGIEGRVAEILKTLKPHLEPEPAY